MSDSIRVLSVHVGKPKQIGTVGAEIALQQAFISGIMKDLVSTPVWCSRTNLSGDGQYDTKHHGGVDKAVLLYSAKSYNAWKQEEDWPDLEFGGFGENLTLSDWTERTVCIGDVFRVGQVVLEVAQPRYPCWKLERRWQRENLVKRVIETGRTGWYARVLKEGFIAPGDEVVLEKRPYEEFTVQFASDVLNARQESSADAKRLRACPALSTSWSV
jgi:MOSC domain-containing protein YiiM